MRTTHEIIHNEKHIRLLGLASKGLSSRFWSKFYTASVRKTGGSHVIPYQQKLERQKKWQQKRFFQSSIHGSADIKLGVLAR